MYNITIANGCHRTVRDSHSIMYYVHRACSKEILQDEGIIIYVECKITIGCYIQVSVNC